MPKSISNLLQLKGNISVKWLGLWYKQCGLQLLKQANEKEDNSEYLPGKWMVLSEKKLLKYKNESGHQEKMQMDKQRSLFKATNIFRILVMMNFSKKYI